MPNAFSIEAAPTINFNERISAHRMAEYSTPITRAHCELTGVDSDSVGDEPTSCGLDFWHSGAGLRWTSDYLHATPALLRVTSATADASLTCLLRRLPGGFSLASAYPYAHITGDVETFWAAKPAIAGTLRQAGVVRLEIPFTGPYLQQLDGTSATLPSNAPAYADEVRHVLDMAGIKELGSNFDPNIRWAIRKAKRNGCTIRDAGSSETQVIQDLYSRTMRAKKAPVNYGPERWLGIAADLAPNNCGRLYIGEIEGRPCGMAAVVDGSVSRHLIQMAIPPDSRSSRLGELLVYTAMQGAQDKGLRYFDFMASSASDAGLIAYKAKWGTAEEPIRSMAIHGIPGLHRAVDFGRWFNRTRALFRGS